MISVHLVLYSQPVVLNELSGLSLTVTRGFEPGNTPPAVIEKPDVVHFVAPCGARLILATDGIWDALDNEDIAEILREDCDSRRACQNLSLAARDMRVSTNRTVDDICAIVINLIGPADGDFTDFSTEVSFASSDYEKRIQ